MYVKFGTDGARGEYSNELMPAPGIITPESAFRIGAAAVETLGLRHWVMVQDTRTFNPELAEAMSEGIRFADGSVIDLGILPTPAGSMIANHLSKISRSPYGAISLTASHNPWRHAGVKVSGANGKKLDDELTGRIEEAANSLSVVRRGVEYSDEQAKHANIDALRQLYPDMLISTIDPDTDPEFLHGKKIVIDAANGAAYWSAPEVFSRLGADVIPIFVDPKGEINKGCGATHTEEMMATVRAMDASYGLALDGDADRLMAFARANGQERLLDGDDAIAIALKGLAAQNRILVHRTAVTDYSTVGFKREMDRRGINVDFVENGDRYVLESLEATGAHVGAEQAGHILYPHVAQRAGTLLTGDGTLAALEQLAVEARLGQPLTEVANFDRLGYGRSDIAVAPGTDAKKIVNSESVSKVIDEAAASVNADGKVLVRGSGTEPIIRVLVKDESQNLVDEIMGRVNRAVLEAVA